MLVAQFNACSYSPCTFYYIICTTPHWKWHAAMHRTHRVVLYVLHTNASMLYRLAIHIYHDGTEIVNEHVLLGFQEIVL